MQNLNRYRLGAANPFVPVDRRYRIVKKCHQAGGRPLNSKDDEATWQLFQFVRRRQAACNTGDQDRLRKDYPDLSIAFDIRFGRARQLRPMIEAYIVAGAADDAIAIRLKLSKETVYWYRNAFFDIEHLRHIPHRILHEVIGLTDDEGRSTLDEHRQWKLLGYFGQIEALDELFNLGGTATKLPEGGIAAWISRRTQSIVQLKQWIAAETLDVHDPEHRKALHKSSLQEQRRQQPSENASLNLDEQNIKELIEAIPWACGADGEALYKGTKIGEWDDSAVELRDDELLRLATGQDVPELEEWRDFKFPPPRKQKPNVTLDPGEDILSDKPECSTDRK